MVTASKAWGSAWQGLNLKRPGRPPRVRLDRATYEQLRAEYIAKYGYVIKIPQWDDIVHFVPRFLMSPEDLKARKMRQFQNILASPTAEWMKPYSSLMTLIDNIQDHVSLIYPTFSMLVRWSPSIFARFIPAMGWILLGFDLLNVANKYLRAPWTAFRGKRALCEQTKGNPFTKKARAERAERIIKWNPGFADLIQVAQTTDQWTGFGLSLGAAVGFAFDAAFGAYRYLTGEKVRVATELPPLNLYELNSAAALKAAAVINSAGQVFDEETHFWSMVSQSAGTRVLTPLIEQYDFCEAVENPLDIVVDAPRPTDPLTIAVIQEAGFRVEDGIGFPMNGQKQIQLKELVEYQNVHANDSVRDYYLRHSKDSYGFIAAHMIDDGIMDLVSAMVPEAEFEEQDTPAMSAFYAMVKAPLRPDADITPEQSREFGQWTEDFQQINEHPPRIQDIIEKFNAMGIPYLRKFNTEMDPTVKELFPDPFDDSEFTD